MSPSSKPDKETQQLGNSVGGPQDLRSQLASDLADAQQAIKYMSLDWDDYEDLLFVQGRNGGDPMSTFSEGSLSSIVIERSGRTMAQLPSGVVNAYSIKDQGKSLLMNLLLQNYIVPNANAQYDMKTKLQMWDMLSNVYGTMFMVYDWVVRDDYVGPDCWLPYIRNCFPQQGRMSPQDSEFFFVSDFMSRDALTRIADEDDKVWDVPAIKDILVKVNKSTAVKPKARDDYLRNNPMFVNRRRSTLTNTDEIEVVTCYERGTKGRWMSFTPDFTNSIIRNIENPHMSGKIPVVAKYSQPIMQSMMGLGDMEKGRYMQYAKDDVIHLNKDRLALSTYPAMKYISGNVSPSSIRMQPLAKIEVTNQNDLDWMPLPENQSDSNLLYQFITGAISNVTGTTDTRVSADSNAPTQGKTPAAIKDSQDSENTRDAMNNDRMMSAVQELYEGFVNLVAVRQKDPIQFYMFGDEIKQIISQGYDDIKDMVKFSGKNKPSADGTQKDVKDADSVLITIQPTKLQNEKGYRYKIDSGSTLAEDQAQQHTQLNEIMTTYIENPTVVETLLNASGQTIDFGAMFKQWFISGGLKNWSDILKDMPTQSPQGQSGASSQGAPGQQAEQQKPPAVSLSGKLGPTGLAGAEQQANLPQDQAQPMAPQPGQQPPVANQLVSQAAQANPQQMAPSPFTDPDIAAAHAQMQAMHSNAGLSQ